MRELSARAAQEPLIEIPRRDRRRDNYRGGRRDHRRCLGGPRPILKRGLVYDAVCLISASVGGLVDVRDGGSFFV